MPGSCTAGRRDYENEKSEFLFVLRHMPDGTKQVLDHKGKTVRTLARGESLSISKRDRAKLVPGDKGRVETIQRIFKLYLEGRGLKAVADALNRSGTPTPRGSAWSHSYAGMWRDSTVRAILVNPAYVGDMVWNRRTDARFHAIAGGEDAAAAPLALVVWAFQVTSLGVLTARWMRLGLAEWRQSFKGSWG